MPISSSRARSSARWASPSAGCRRRCRDAARPRIRFPTSEQTGGASDDIGDIMWSVPTVTLRFPSNIPGATGHHWTSAVAMATPVAHKGATQGAKVYAMTMLDLLMRPDVIAGGARLLRDPAGAGEVQAAAAARRQAGDLAEQEHDGQVQAGAAEVLLTTRRNTRRISSSSASRIRRRCRRGRRRSSRVVAGRES